MKPKRRFSSVLQTAAFVLGIVVAISLGIVDFRYRIQTELLKQENKELRLARDHSRRDNKSAHVGSSRNEDVGGPGESQKPTTKPVEPPVQLELQQGFGDLSGQALVTAVMSKRAGRYLTAASHSYILPHFANLSVSDQQAFRTLLAERESEKYIANRDVTSRGILPGTDAYESSLRLATTVVDAKLQTLLGSQFGTLEELFSLEKNWEYLRRSGLLEDFRFHDAPLSANAEVALLRVLKKHSFNPARLAPDAWANGQLSVVFSIAADSQDFLTSQQRDILLKYVTTSGSQNARAP